MLQRCLFDCIKNRVFNQINDCQHGFISGKNCVTQLIEVFDKIHNLLDRGKQIDVIYLGMSKAFDKVSYKRLLLRLRRFGFSGNILNWFHSYSQDRSQQTTILGATSSPTAVTSGVPQGSVLVHCYSCYTRTIYLPVLQAPLLRLTTPRYSRK